MPSSSIDTSGIDVDYPVAGEDNDSQGFRTNFTEIKAALDAATSDINTLFVTGGYAGSRGVIGYSGSAGVAGSAGGLGYTGSAGAGGGGGGYTGSASTVVGYSGSAGAVGIGYTGSASTVVGYSGSAGAGGGGGGLTYRTSNFTATANTQYIVDTAGGSVTITLPATPATGDYVTFTAAYLQTNTVTVTDGGILTEVYDKAIDGAKYYYDGAAWVRIQDGTVRSFGNTSSYYEVAVFDDNNSNVIHRSPVRIWYGDGDVEIPAPTNSAVAYTLSVTGFGGYTGSVTDTAKPAIVSNGAAYTTTVTVTQSGTTIDIDCGLSNVFYSNLTGTLSTINLNNPSDGQTINWFIRKEAPTTVTWPAAWLWQNGIPSAVTAAASTDVLTATYLATTASWYVTLLTDMKVSGI